mmetsp:Transcript_21869/g.85709  ORF Transcript_21869/g.85709 Transcript_21869/m.85709 type:complete len:285 (+) Transcript_21869:68-922(+)
MCGGLLLGLLSLPPAAAHASGDAGAALLALALALALGGGGGGAGGGGGGGGGRGRLTEDGELVQRRRRADGLQLHLRRRLHGGELGGRLGGCRGLFLSVRGGGGVVVVVFGIVVIVVAHLLVVVRLLLLFIVVVLSLSLCFCLYVAAEGEITGGLGRCGWRGLRLELSFWRTLCRGFSVVHGIDVGLGLLDALHGRSLRLLLSLCAVYVRLCVRRLQSGGVGRRRSAKGREESVGGGSRLHSALGLRSALLHRSVRDLHHRGSESAIARLRARARDRRGGGRGC